MTAPDMLWNLVEDHLAAEKLELDDLEMVGRGRGRTLRVVVEGADLDRLAEVSRTLSRRLDTEVDIDGPYQLEVSSPGLERSLRRPAHFEKSVGREVVVKATTGEQRETLRGQIRSADASGFVLGTKDGEDRRLEYSDVTSATTVFRWERNPRPGR